MPLTILEEVTQEFVQSLERNQMKLVVYWDGEGRRMKAGTTSKRRECRDTEWSHLRQYCTYGVVPHSSSALCRKDWLQNFPLTRLFIHQIQFTLRQVPTVVMIQCEEEADREVAKASAENENCYCVGMDSDYFFFPNTKYVPLNTLNSSGSVVSGCVITRGELADHLGLPCEAAMVEFAILMGNDYVGNSK
jgi:5'-3' exonuclease